MRKQLSRCHDLGIEYQRNRCFDGAVVSQTGLRIAIYEVLFGIHLQDCCKTEPNN